MTMAEPGWYLDPTDPTRLREWDGSVWTDATQPLPASGPAPTQAQPVGPDGRHAPTALQHPRHRRRPVVWVGVIVAVAMVAGAGAFALVNRGDDDQPGIEVVLEVATAAGRDPFMASVANPDLPAVPSGGVAQPTDAPSTIQALSATTSGLFGGTGNLTACDTNQLARTLTRDSQLGDAFAGAARIPSDQLASWIGTLTPVILREDTRVTNHGYLNGAATPFQAVLQAGTAVLISPTGLPVVRCACGNPLAPPEAVAPTYTGEAWGDFDPRRITTVTPANEPLTTIDVADVATGEVLPETVNAGGLVLAPDGLGVARFGDDTTSVIATISEILGPPDEIRPDFVAGGAFSVVTWGALTLVFQVPRPGGGDEPGRFGFDSYYFGPAESVDAWSPAPWERQLTTAEGIGIGSSGEVANAAYPQTTLTRRELPGENIGLDTICSVELSHQGLDPLPGLPLQNQRIWAEMAFIERQFTGVFFVPLIDDIVTRIGGARPGSAACMFA